MMASQPYNSGLKCGITSYIIRDCLPYDVFHLKSWNAVKKGINTSSFFFGNNRCGRLINKLG